MKTLLVVLSILGLLLTAGGCATPFGAANYGGLVTNHVKGPVGGVDNTVNPSKTGEATAKSIIFFAEGDASIKTAMENGRITRVHHIDNEVFSVFGIYATYKTIVYGE